MADMALGDLLETEGVNKRAKLMRSMQGQAQSLRKMGFEPQEIDLLIRGQHGLLRPEDAEPFQLAMRKLALMKRVTGVPGMAKGLRGWPGAAGGDGMAGEALEGMGFGGGGMSLGDLLR